VRWSQPLGCLLVAIFSHGLAVAQLVSLAAMAMLCAKCHQKEATVHFTTVVDGREEEAVHLCTDCAPDTGFDLADLDLKQIEALSVIGKKCEFCARDAFSGEMRTGGGAVYWCIDCGRELAVIVRDLLIAERPDLLQGTKEESSFLSFCSDPGLREWSAAASGRAIQTLKERRRQDGRDKGS
jgi:hypothetical protein